MRIYFLGCFCCVIFKGKQFFGEAKVRETSFSTFVEDFLAEESSAHILVEPPLNLSY